MPIVILKKKKKNYVFIIICIYMFIFIFYILYNRGRGTRVNPRHLSYLIRRKQHMYALRTRPSFIAARRRAPALFVARAAAPHLSLLTRTGGCGCELTHEPPPSPLVATKARFGLAGPLSPAQYLYTTLQTHIYV